MSPPPHLSSDRLSLRAMTISDWPDYEAFMASQNSRYMGGPFPSGRAWGMFCSDHAQWSLLGCGALMVDDRQTGHTLGQVAINSGPLFPEFELGWFLYPHARGRGHATQAARVLQDWAKSVRGIATLVSYIDPGNHASIRVAQRLNATLDGQAARPHPEDLVFRHYGTPSPACG